jgi:hypothetical protein
MNLDAQTHINTFSGGMYRDVNVIHQPDGTYRYAKNFQVVSHDGNNVSLKDSLGNRVVFTLPAPYNAIVANTQTEPTAIGMLSFPDTIVVFSTNYNGATGTAYGEIGYLKYLPFGESIEGTTTTVGGYTYGGYVPLYHHLSLNFHKGYEINNEGFGYQENEYVKRVYWTDNLNEPRVFNIADPIFTTYYASGTLSAVAGTYYMVLGGAITYNGTNYGPGLTAGNVFPTSGGIQVYAQAAGTPLVIKYYPYQLLNWTPSRTLGGIHFSDYGSGSVTTGGKMYFYRLGLNSGYFTSWSYGCPPIHVGMANTVVTGIAYHNFVGNGGLGVTPVNSGKSVKIAIDNIDINFDIIQMACCEFDQAVEVPTSISIVQQATITGTSMVLEHLGGTNLGTLTTDDITTFPASIITAKTICTNKNYNLVGNLTERKEFPAFDNSTIAISSVDYPIIQASDPRLGVNDFIYASPDPTVGINPAATTIRPYSRWLVTAGNDAGNRVEYPVASGTYYYLGDVFVGVAGSTTATFTGTAAARPCTYKRRYTPITSLNPNTTQRNDAIEFKTQNIAFWNYKNPAVAAHNRGYWSTEKYRFGILFYDKKGNPFYVRHLGDYTMPSINTKGGLMRSGAYAPDNSAHAPVAQIYALNPSGVNIDGINIPQEIVDQCSGFSIVRAERDPRVLMQGLVFPCTADTVTTPGLTIIRPMATMFLSGDAYLDTAQGCYSYIVPDYNVCDWTVSKLIRGLTGTPGSGNPTIEQACWLTAFDFAGGGVCLATQADYSVHGTLFADALQVGAARSATIAYWSGVNEADYITGFLPNQDFANDGIQAAAVTGAIVDNFYGGQNQLNARRGTGGKKIFISLNSDFNAFDNTSYYSQIGTGTSEKILMNYIRDNTNPYGGSGAVALANTLYISTGHFQQFDATVLAETLNGTFATGVYAGQNKYTFNGVHVFGGDCYTNLIDYGYELYNDTITANPYSYGLFFPCENNANYDLRRGNKISNLGMLAVGGAYPTGIQYSGPGPLTVLESYSYNEGYSSEGDVFQYPALPVNFLNAGRFPERIRFAGEKFIGEILDSFRTFLTNDYKDVNVVYGEINNLRPKGDYVYYWQNNAIGASPIKQRQLISGANGSETVLGTGGVIDYYQTISTVWGNQHRHGLTETKDGWIWFDMRNKSVCVLNYNGGANDITVPLGLKSWFNEIFVQVSNSSLITIGLIDDPTFGVQMDQPLLGVGICGVYDPKTQTSYLTFKFKNEPTSTTVTAKDFTIGFNHQINKFTGFYDMYPGIWHRHYQFVLSCNNPKNIQKYYGTGMASTDFVVGDVIADLNNEYICTTAGTVAAYATPPSGAIFTSINKTNQIWVQNEEVSYATPPPGYVYNKMYGRVVDNELIVIVNPKSGRPFSVDTIAQQDYNVNFTDIYYSNTNQTGADNSITGTNRDYQYVDGELWGSVPNANGSYGKSGRFTDLWLQVRMVKKNWTTVPTTVTTSVKILGYLKSLWRLKF